MTKPAALSIGVASTVGPDRAARIAADAENAGFHALWINDTPHADSLACLAAAADVTQRIRLCTGVIPVDRRPVAEIAASLAALPQERLVLGIGSGATRAGVVRTMRAAITDLHRDTAARVMLGALGPKMRELAATEADGPLLSWLTPEVAAAQSAEAHDSRADTHVALYVRTALDEAAVPRLREEAARYGSFPQYAANFARLGFTPDDTVITPADAAARITAYRVGVDEVVLRAITEGDDTRDDVRFVEQAAALL